MTKKCEVNWSFTAKRTQRKSCQQQNKKTFFTKFKKISFKSDILKRNIRLNVSNAALRTVDFKGGLDKFLKSAKSKRLSKRVQKLKYSIISQK